MKGNLISLGRVGTTELPWIFKEKINWLIRWKLTQLSGLDSARKMESKCQVIGPFQSQTLSGSSEVAFLIFLRHLRRASYSVSSKLFRFLFSFALWTSRVISGLGWEEKKTEKTCDKISDGLVDPKVHFTNVSFVGLLGRNNSAVGWLQVVFRYCSSCDDILEIFEKL